MGETWDCEAYGPDGRAAGALCFFAPDLGGRVCTNRQECAERMAAERQQAFDRIQAGAAAGDPIMAVLAEEFTSPDQLLNADRDPDGQP